MLLKVNLLFLIILFGVGQTFAQFNSITTTKQINDVPLKLSETPSDSTIIPETLIYKDTIMSRYNDIPITLLGISRLPLDKINLTSGYGHRVHPTLKINKFHNGIDLSARRDSIHSVLHGVVHKSAYNNIIGNFIIVNHGHYETTYGHLSMRYVQVGDLVKAGTVLGISGATGRVTGEHLHFIVKCKGIPINPLPFLKKIISTNNPTNLIKILTQINR